MEFVIAWGERLLLGTRGSYMVVDASDIKDAIEIWRRNTSEKEKKRQIGPLHIGIAPETVEFCEKCKRLIYGETK